LDYFECDKSKATTSTPFNPIGAVPVIDRYGMLTIDIKKVGALCNPAEVDGQLPGAAMHAEHGVTYQTRTTRNTSKFLKVSNQKVVNALGTTHVDVKRPARLFLPSASSRLSPPPPLSAPHTEHFQCYKISKTRGTDLFVEIPNVVVVDQFENYLPVTVKKPSMLCVPVNVDGGQPGAENPVLYPDVLLCYKVKRPQGLKFATVTGVFVNNDFGPLTFDVLKTEQLCVPSLIMP
jgi:hypothetical protein